MKINKLLVAMLAAGFAMPALAETEQVVDTKVTAEVTPEVAGEQSDKDVVQVENDVDTADVIEAKLEAYVSKMKRGIEKQGKQHKVFIYSGSAELDVDRNNPNWAKFRERALEKAILDARKSYLETLNTSFENNQIASMAYSNGLPAPTKDDFKTDSKMVGFLDKVVAVLDGKLDAELKDMGIDPKQYNAAPPAIKRDLFKESVAEQSVRSSYGDLSGMMVVKVFEEIRESGQGTIGAILVLSAKKRDQIKAMVDSDGDVAPQADKKNTKLTSIHDYLASRKNSLYLKSGTNIVYDAEGYPLIIAYGQSGVTYSSSSSKKKIERKVAKSFATNNAWANLSRAYNLNGDFENKTTSETQVSESEKFEFIADAVRSTSSSLTQNLIESVEERAAMSSAIKNMTGVSTEYEWRRKHPITGHEMVGTVLVWHPKKITNAKNMASGKSDEQLDIELDGPSGSIHSAESEDIFDAADF
jgi:hypothetical protein